MAEGKHLGAELRMGAGADQLIGEAEKHADG